MTYYCVPDLHGRYDLYIRIMQDLDKKDPTKIIFLGDYIDRGPQSVEIVEALRLYDGKHELVTLMGNHEQMFLQGEVYDSQAYYQIKSHKNSYMIRRWMEDLKLFHIEDNYNIFAHAYYNLNLREQDAGEVLWRRMSDSEAFHDDFYLTHGHTPRTHGPILSPNRCNLDTKAFQTGKIVVGCYEKNRKGPANFIEY
jgi:serine/threonine protein phosphatase 1